MRAGDSASRARSLYDLIRTGELKAIKVANRTLIPESELQRFVAERLAAA